MGPTQYRLWDKERTGKFQELLLPWYARHKRQLPWRMRPHPYRIWISEIMLQQTQVQTVLPYYERFLKRFPNVERLAAAPESEVMALWAGLGYYGRARSLHRAAKTIVEKHDAEFPADPEEILKLPGVGRYTAGAIASIAYNQDQPVVDGNVRRVMSRLLALDGRAPDSFFWNQAAAWIPAGRAAEFNQAVMELGALVCLPAQPLCLLCPVQSLCQARARGIQGLIPRARNTRISESVFLVILVLHQEGRVLLVRQRDVPYIPGEWGLPTRILRAGAAPQEVAQDLSRSLLRASIRLEERAPVRHSITFRRIAIHVFYGELTRPAQELSEPKTARWFSRKDLAMRVTSSAFRKALRSALGNL